MCPAAALNSRVFSTCTSRTGSASRHLFGVCATFGSYPIEVQVARDYNSVDTQGVFQCALMKSKHPGMRPGEAGCFAFALARRSSAGIVMLQEMRTMRS